MVDELTTSEGRPFGRLTHPDLCQAALAFLERQVSQSVADDCVYHYTTYPSLQGIEDSRQLRLSGIRFLNDSMEYFQALKLALDEAERRTNCENTGVANFWKQYLRLWGKVPGRMVGMHQMFADDRFVACFTEAGNLLSQWRAYCPTGGVSIGFHVDDIRATYGPPIVANSRSGGCLSPVFAKCEYDEAEQGKVMASIADEVERALIAVFEGSRLDPATTDPTTPGWHRMMNHHSLFTRSVAAIAPLFKHHKFSEEKEWRLIVACEDTRLGLNHVRQLPPYIKRDLPPVASITIGPTTDSDSVVGAAKKMFPTGRTTRRDFRTDYCEIPYRGR